MEVEIKITENETFIEQEEKFLKGLLEKYRSENPKEEINLEEKDIKIYGNTEYGFEFLGNYPSNMINANKEALIL